MKKLLFCIALLLMSVLPMKAQEREKKADWRSSRICSKFPAYIDSSDYGRKALRRMLSCVYRNAILKSQDPEDIVNLNWKFVASICVFF